MIRNVTAGFFVGLSLMLLTSSVYAAATPTVGTPSANGYAHPEWLVDSAWLAAHLADPLVKIVALTPAKDFEAGHVPGAAQVDWPVFQIVETSDQSVKTWESAVETELTALGISPNDTVIVYDGGTVYAPRLWWILHQLGHRDVRILNGGFEAWSASGAKIESGASNAQPAPSAYVGHPDASAIAILSTVAASVGSPNVTFVDARRADEYAAGHIPGAINIPFTDNAASTSPHAWKSAGALRAMYLAAGITPGKQVIAYCSTGVRSAATYFTLLLIGYPNVALFTGSWMEWSAHPDLPVTKGSAP